MKGPLEEVGLSGVRKVQLASSCPRQRPLQAEETVWGSESPPLGPDSGIWVGLGAVGVEAGAATRPWRRGWGLRGGVKRVTPSGAKV